MKFCPHCGGDIAIYQAAENSRPVQQQDSRSPPAVASSPPGPYDQTKVWCELVERARSNPEPTSIAAVVEPAIDKFMKAIAAAHGAGANNQCDTIVHVVFDKPIVPRGGVLHQAMKTDGQSGMTLERFKDMGYLVLDGKVVEVDGIPVSPAYGALNYWGGEKQFKRWHLTGPVTVNPSRNGNPFFMDEEMLAFGAIWRDMLKIKEALTSLFISFAEGVSDGKPIAKPVALELAFR